MAHPYLTLGKITKVGLWLSRKESFEILTLTVAGQIIIQNYSNSLYVSVPPSKMKLMF